MTVESPPAVYAIATMDTKSDELRFVADCMRRVGVAVRIVDVSTQVPGNAAADVTPGAILHAVGAASDSLVALDRGEAVGRMSEALAVWLNAESAAGRVLGVIGLGGSGGTALVTRAMRQLPIGVPKLMVSTVASGNTAAYVDCSDICMMYSVVDVAGLNSVSRRVLSNASHAMAGMVRDQLGQIESRPAVGMTMFGVTTTCVTHVRRALEEHGYDCLVFHATGAGGRAMEKLVESGLLVGVLDVTTTEVADELVGGVFPSGPERFDRILKSGIPYVISAGALDMVNFGARDTVPERFQSRRLHVHNAQVTLMRTTADENRRIGRWIAGKLNSSQSPLTVLLPERGVSAIDSPGQPFWDPEADAALFDELTGAIHATAARQLRRLPCHINDPQFAEALVSEFLALAGRGSRAR